MDDDPLASNPEAAMSRSLRTSRSRQVLGEGSLVVALVLVPWAIYLAASLPAEHTATHWNLAWAGFDVALCGAFGAIAWAVRWRSCLIAPVLLATGVLMGADSWFDVTTALGTSDQALALAEAALELPLAIAAGGMAVRIALVSSREGRDPRRAGAPVRANPRSRDRC